MDQRNPKESKEGAHKLADLVTKENMLGLVSVGDHHIPKDLVGSFEDDLAASQVFVTN